MDEYKKTEKRGFNCIYSHDSVVRGGGNGGDDDHDGSGSNLIAII